ncbi:MAG: translation initiation factor IF-2 subunit alpha, partial [Candidatus Aenigmatarchaeota archaeon]
LKINPHSALAHLIEYDTTGLIHVSEVASRWVKDIREFIKENQYVVCLVLESSPESISLSLKRVHKEDAERKLNEFKRERRSEKLLEMAGKSIGKTLEQTKKEIGNLVIEEFGSYTKLFELALKNPDLLKSKGLSDKWVKAIVDIAKKNFGEKTYEVRGILKLISYDSNGIEWIKKTLLKAKSKGVDAHYISAPKYLLIAKGKNYKEIENRLKTVADEITKEFKKYGDANFEFERA